MFKVFSAETSCFVLDGGLPRWLREGRPTESGPIAPPPPGPTLVASDANVESWLQTLEQVKAHSVRLVAGATPGAGAILDARGSDRFLGAVPEPRAGLRSGHIPGSLNVPFAELLREDGTFKDRDATLAVFRRAGIDPLAVEGGASSLGPVTTSCGSGVTATIVSFALEHHFGVETSVYDGSWSEWGQEGNGCPVDARSC